MDAMKPFLSYTSRSGPGYYRKNRSSGNANILSYMVSSSTKNADGKRYSRLVDRDGDFYQSEGRISIKKRISGKDWRALYYGDLFHSLVDAPILRILFVLLSGYVLLTSLFAFIYLTISVRCDCNLSIKNFTQAFFFSLETMATIGYSTADIFFGDCIIVVIVLTVNVCTKLVVEAFIIGVIYCRLSNPTRRSKTIIFSKQAIIRRVRGKLYFMLQVCELRKHQLVEAHVRLYVVRRDVSVVETATSPRVAQNLFGLSEKDVEMGEGGGIGVSNDCGEAGEVSSDRRQVVKRFQTCDMRLNHPNDELGGMLLMCLPQVIVHELDCWSPLMPPPVWVSAENPRDVVQWVPPAFRWTEDDEEDAIQGNQAYPEPSHVGGVEEKSRLSKSDALKSADQASAPYTRATAAPTLPRSGTRNRKKVTYNGDILNAVYFPSVIQRASTNSAYVNRVAGRNGVSGDYGRDKKTDSDCPFSSSSFDHMEEETSEQRDERCMIERFMSDRRAEIVAVIEGVDPTSGGVVQARHSYTHDDVEWNKSFAPCVFEDSDDGAALIDFSVFHDLVEVPFDSSFAESTSVA